MRHQQRRLLFTVFAAAYACACAPKSASRKTPQTHAVALPAAPSTSIALSELPEPVAAPRVSVAWPEKMPKEPIIDGDLREWGSLVPRETEEKPAPARMPRSHVAFALTSEAAFVLAELSAESMDGVWLGVASAAAKLPPIGHSQPGGENLAIDCTKDAAGKPLNADQMLSCRSDQASRDVFIADQKARFEVMYRLDKGGIQIADAKGLLAPIANALVTTKASSRGILLEARLPLEALPRVSSAPVRDLSLYADYAAAAKRPFPTEQQWIRVSAPDPISFEPYGDLRAASFALQAKRLRPTGFSYHPAKPNLVEFVKYAENSSTLALRVEEKVLYEPLKALGSVEVGTLAAPSPMLAIRAEGKLVDSVDLDAEPLGAIVKDKAIHVFSFTTGTNNETSQQWAKWSVLAIDEKGSCTEPINEDTGVHGWHSVVDFHSEKWDRFGLRGIPTGFADEETPHLIEIAWRYDKQFAGYMPTTRQINEMPKPRQTKK